eukprot:366443-Chlamydomonas_euryale.AAC.5
MGGLVAVMGPWCEIPGNVNNQGWACHCYGTLVWKPYSVNDKWAYDCHRTGRETFWKREV